MAAIKEVAIKKRTAIDKSNRNMFIVVTLVSVVVGVAAVGVVFLFQKMLFMDKVIDEKQKTAAIVEMNSKIVMDLQERIRELLDSPALLSAKLPTAEDPLTVIGDALPIPEVDDEAKMVSSLSERLLTGVTLESLSFLENGELGTTEFTFSVSGDINAIQGVLRQLERSIRQIDILDVAVSYEDDGKITLTANAMAYWTEEIFVPEKLPTKEVTP